MEEKIYVTENNYEDPLIIDDKRQNQLTSGRVNCGQEHGKNKNSVCTNLYIMVVVSGQIKKFSSGHLYLCLSYS